MSMIALLLIDANYLGWDCILGEHIYPIIIILFTPLGVVMHAGGNAKHRLVILDVCMHTTNRNNG